MRTLFLTLSIVVGLSMIPAVDGGNAVASGPAFGSVVLAAPAVEPAQKMPQMNIDIHDGSSPSWNPMWIAIGVIGLLLVAVLFKMSNRGGTR